MNVGVPAHADQLTAPELTSACSRSAARANLLAIPRRYRSRMSVELPLPLTLDQAHGAAIDDVNRWRGHCIESCARIERAAGETLAAAATASKDSKRPPVMFGDRMKALRVLFASGSKHSDPELLKCLARIEDELGRRNVFVHASGTVWVDANGNWLWSYWFDPMRKGEAPSSGQIEKREARGIEQALARGAQSLRNRLQNFRANLEAFTE